MRAAGSALAGIFFLLFCLFLTRFDTGTVELFAFVFMVGLIIFTFWPLLKGKFKLNIDGSGQSAYSRRKQAVKRSKSPTAPTKWED